MRLALQRWLRRPPGPYEIGFVLVLFVLLVLSTRDGRHDVPDRITHDVPQTADQ